MPEILQKLSPDRDLQCYFERPSAIAGLSNAGPSGYTLSGCFRQQFDWAVVEWNRDNVFEHPALRFLPDGDLSGLTLTYEEERENCVPIDSDLYPTVDWKTLRIWAGPAGAEDVYFIDLRSHAVPVEGAYTCASAEFTLEGTASAGSVIGIEFLGQHHTYEMYGSDTLESAVQAIVDSVNAFSPWMAAERTGSTIRLLYVGRTSDGAKADASNSTTGSNGNRVGAYSYHADGSTANWDQGWRLLTGGTSPTRWRITLNFGSLADNRSPARLVPTQQVRKMRWTYAADLQSGAFSRSEYAVRVSNWQVTGAGRQYAVAGPGSQRLEDGDERMTYSGGSWHVAHGNYSGGSIRWTQTPGSSVSFTYTATAGHKLLIGSRCTYVGAALTVEVDGQAQIFDTRIPGEDVLARIDAGWFGPGTHVVTVSHTGSPSEYLYFDFAEIAFPTYELPDFPVAPRLTAATDWDTDHSIALAAERTAWLLTKMGFVARANHYVGALWFYELIRSGHAYASATVDFSGIASPNQITSLTINREGLSPAQATVLEHLHHLGDTPSTIALAFALELNRGYTAIRAEATGGTLTIFAREMGGSGNGITIACSSNDAALQIAVSGPTLGGGVDGTWIVDQAATPRINRAARDWSRAYHAALWARQVDSVAGFSTELQHGDTSVAAGIVQRGPAGDPILLPTPAIQTTFSNESLAFWREVHREMAQIMVEAGVTPYLQFGEVQWWYFNTDGLGRQFSGMPYYDAATQAAFTAQYGRPMAVIANHFADPNQHPEEAAFLAARIGWFCDQIIDHVRASFPDCRFEVLYPTDVNQTPWNFAVNYAPSWNPTRLTCLKTEGFGNTYNRDVESAKNAMAFGADFGPSRRAHLVGVGDPDSSWVREARHALRAGFESVVFWALDQFCLVGYPLPFETGARRSVRLGS